MARKKSDEQTRTIELLEKMLVFQLWAIGINQERIAKTVKKKRAWVNKLVKGIAIKTKSPGK